MKYFVLGFDLRRPAGRGREDRRDPDARSASGTRSAAGYFHGLGAVGEAEIGHFDPSDERVRLGPALGALRDRLPLRQHHDRRRASPSSTPTSPWGTTPSR
ncbi:MAG: hypothetical protein MZV70_37995 [Desulfobacterales bacterium]|nr:hypothetical protein [Desulfobacterales bacterium]